jgi:hypothetical protein
MTIRGGAGGSTLANMGARRRQLQAARKNLSMDAERGAPQAPTRTQPQPAPPPQQPAQPSRGGNRAAMVQQIQEFVTQQRARGQGAAPRPQERPVQRVSTRPGPADRLGERVEQLGAAGRPIETQFFRLAGREGTPREISLFRSRLELERQLNRPPTERELRMWMARPASLGTLVQSAIEPPVQGTALGAPATPGGA